MPRTPATVNQHLHDKTPTQRHMTLTTMKPNCDQGAVTISAFSTAQAAGAAEYDTSIRWTICRCRFRFPDDAIYLTICETPKQSLQTTYHDLHLHNI